jgi:small GTP-binding protein
MNQNHNKVKQDIKIITLGDSRVGKTSLIIKYIDNKFTGNFVTTMGFDIKNKQLTLKDGTEAKLMLFDTAGQERFRSLAENYIKKAYGVLLVYDISERQSFLNIENWMQSIKENSDGLPTILIGNKSDLNDERKVSFEEGNQKAQEFGCPFYETSCKNGDNVNKCFIELAELVYEKIGKKSSQNDHQILRKNSSKRKKKCCS